MPKSIWETAFQISTSGRTVPALASIANLESLELSIDNVVQDWYAIGGDGFAQNLVTAKKITLAGVAKVTDTDAGNTYLQGLMLALGTAAQSTFSLTFPSGDILAGDCNIVINSGLGAAEDVDVIEFEVHLDGKPTLT